MQITPSPAPQLRKFDKVVMVAMLACTATVIALSAAGPEFVVAAAIIAPALAAVAIGRLAAHLERRRVLLRWNLLAWALCTGLAALAGQRWLVRGQASAFIGASFMMAIISLLPAWIAYSFTASGASSCRGSDNV